MRSSDSKMKHYFNSLKFCSMHWRKSANQQISKSANQQIISALLQAQIQNGHYQNKILESHYDWIRWVKFPESIVQICCWHCAV